MAIPAPNAIAWYDEHSTAQSELYEAVDPSQLRAWLIDLLPEAPALLLDVGAGSGRDAAWLASLGHDVVAVEPSAAMRTEAMERHRDANVWWLDDSLPGLSDTLKQGLAFDVILLCAVWQHVAPTDRARAMRKLISLLRPGGMLAITLRHGPADSERGMHPVSLAEVERLARGYGGSVALTVPMADQQGRTDIIWTGVAIRLPDDGTDALPLLRHIILNDQKASTYKLGLLRALCRAADSQSGLAQDRGEDAVAVPLGLVALNWLRLYLPLIEARLPQAPRNEGPDGLWFAGPGFRALLDGAVARLDIRVGAQFGAPAAPIVRDALQEAADLIARMPATYITYPNGGPILPAIRKRAPTNLASFSVDEAFLAGFGSLEVPRTLWRALERFAVWVEPALIAEWSRLMRAYAMAQGRTLDESRLAAAMTWSDPTRDVTLPRERALELMTEGVSLRCVWSGRPLDAQTLDIDHCFPWSAWPCDDLWNLLPAHPIVNQRLKRDRLPSDSLLRSASDAIGRWWTSAYLSDPILRGRFVNEAHASLPGLARGAEAPSVDELLDAVRIQRLRLRHDQQVTEWAP